MRYMRLQMKVGFWLCGLSFMATTLAYWYLADWGWYAELPQGRELMNVSPLWCQALESGLAGGLAATVLSGGWAYGCVFYNRLTVFPRA
jgi:hypothetical protein